jgi:predicted RNA-binding Zn-ribbon protein involved in translation (DUF1610 family)
VIEVSLGLLVVIALGIMLAGVFGAWFFSEWQRQRRERLAFRGVLFCTSCGCEFSDDSREPLAQCPRCGSMNERLRLRRW